MKTKSIIAGYWLFTIMLLLSCGQSPAKEQQFVSKKTQSDNCDNPDAEVNCCFENMPANVLPVMTIAGKTEPGNPLIISGTIFKENGKTPYPDVWLYAYHTDHTGRYTKSGTETGIQKWHGRLRGWCRTDSNGRYEIRTVRPAPYPDNSMPAHIHAAIKTDDGPALYISDFVFKDDPLVNEKYLSSLKGLTGGTGVVDLIKKEENTWMGKRDIVLKR